MYKCVIFPLISRTWRRQYVENIYEKFLTKFLFHYIFLNVFFNINPSYISQLSQRIHLRATNQSDRGEKRQNFNKTFPYFVWLLRDVLLNLPSDCPTIKDYFLKRVWYILELRWSGKVRGTPIKFIYGFMIPIFRKEI